MEAKKALEEAGGDFEKAVDILRKKGLSAAAKKAARVASEGMIASSIQGGGKAGVLIEVNSETDFVAKNEEFQAFAKSLAEVVASQKPADVAALSQLIVNGENVEAKRNALVQKIGENISIRRFVRFETSGSDCDLSPWQPYRRDGGLYRRRRATRQGPCHAHCRGKSAVPEPGIGAGRRRSTGSGRSTRARQRNRASRRRSSARSSKESSRSSTPTPAWSTRSTSRTLTASSRSRTCSRRQGPIINRFVRYQLGEGIEKKKENFADEVAAQLK